MTKRHAHWIAAVAVLAGLAATSTSALALDKLKIAVGHRGLFDTAISEVGQRAGIFKKHGVQVDVLYTAGSGETEQAVISGSADLAVATGIMGALGAYAKGAPIRIVGAEATGAGDLYWYVKTDSPIKSIKDFSGKTIAYSTKGSSTNGVVDAFITEYDLKGAKPTATGSPPGTLTATMTGQVDVGWAAPPFGLDQLAKHEIRQIATGNDTSFKNKTVRVTVANLNTLTKRKDVIERYMQGYRETIDALYSDPKVLKIYADFAHISLDKAKQVREFFSKDALNPDQIKDLGGSVKEAVTLKFTPKELTKAQVAELVQIPPRK
jgi:ABC-type nitrate/sulfonate/bicarbonate transport system substrate-binding protein